MKIHNVEQGTQAWHELRLCKITASKFDLLMGKKFGKTVYTYAYELVAEKLTGTWKDINAKAIEWGNEHESDAREYYKKTTFNYVKKIGFIEYDNYIGCSPDGFVGKYGTIEIKCPYNSSNHIISLAKKEAPDIYLSQIHGQLWLSGRSWCDFVSYDPRVQDKSKKIVIIRVDRDDEMIDKLKTRVFEFKKIVQDILKQLKE